MNMCFKDFVWERNPDSVSIRCERAVKEIRQPFSGSLLQDTGLEKRVAEGRGTFLGADCFAQFGALAQVFSLPGPGLLTLPETPPFWAVFRLLEMLAQSRPNTVEYRFSFLESGKPNVVEPVPPVYHCAGGENLWAVAARYGVPPSRVLENSFVHWPSCLKQGEILVLKGKGK